MASAERSAVAAASLVALLRQKLCAAERTAGLDDCAHPLALGIPAIDAALGGGLAGGALHEIAAAREAEIAAATGFALALAARIARQARDPNGTRRLMVRDAALRAAPHHEAEQCSARIEAGGTSIPERIPEQSPRILRSPFPPEEETGVSKDEGTYTALSSRGVLWIAEDLSLAESGAPYGPGLEQAGLAPERLITVAAARGRDVLWAMEEALRCRAVGLVIGELRARDIDAVATRRLALAAAAGNSLGLLLRPAPDDAPCRRRDALDRRRRTLPAAGT